jgi:protein-S-isoprenylcysteine O-methyltransferase Ste14
MQLITVKIEKPDDTNFILRTRWEDQTLQPELPGYKKYTQRVRYRLVPGVW